MGGRCRPPIPPGSAPWSGGPSTPPQARRGREPDRRSAGVDVRSPSKPGTLYRQPSRVAAVGLTRGGGLFTRPPVPGIHVRDAVATSCLPQPEIGACAPQPNIWPSDAPSAHHTSWGAESARGPSVRVPRPCTRQHPRLPRPPYPRRIRVSPSCAEEATRTPSRVKTRPRANPRDPAATGESTS
jgi:hypothetical protein